jgi:hypothetical protein
VVDHGQLAEIQRDEFRRQAFVTCVAYRNHNRLQIPLKSIAWAELLNLNLFMVSG